MGLREEYDFEYLVNEAEHLVIHELETQLEFSENADVCRTQDCMLDMAAFALNQVPPLYRATLLGRIYAQELDQKYHDQVTEAVRTAIARVRDNPPSTV
ncbi:MAG: competence protein ComFB [Spirochaetes bacterium]|jgi:competence protein ComFB|nr:competence protein ComFB [Spirochaetota bacterium]